MALSAGDVPDQSGRVAVVTGANGRFGLEVSRELGRKGARVVMASRDQDRPSGPGPRSSFDVRPARVAFAHTLGRPHACPIRDAFASEEGVGRWG